MGSSLDPIRVTSEVGGRIRNIYIQEGSEVQAGSLLVQLDPRGLLLKKRSIESRIHLAELRLSRLVSRLGRDGLAALYDDLAQTRLNLGRLTITSPADGKITFLASLDTGQIISAGTPLATLVPRSDDLVIESWLRSSDRTYVTPGQRVRLHTDSLPPDQYNTLEGTVLSISPNARVLISLSLYSPELHPGLTFNVHFTTRQLNRTPLSRQKSGLFKVYSCSFCF